MSRHAVIRTAGVSIGVVVVAAAASGVALASGHPAFTGATLVNAELRQAVHLNSDRVKLQTKGVTDVMVQRVDVTGGGASGWHHHPGMVIVTVQSGKVTVTDATCRTVTYGPGESAGAVFVESGDAPGQVTGAPAAVLYATFVTPDGQLARINDPAPTCAS